LQLGIEERLLGVGYFQINGRSFLVAKHRQIAEVGQADAVNTVKTPV
jgi:hypothetical protein